jgi:Predicted nucleic acid-binding protein, contains PIN domain
MRLWDVNLWVYAFRSDSPLHTRALASMQSSLDRRESFVFTPGVAATFLRLVTNSRIFKEPSPISEAWLFVDALESHPAALLADMDPMAFGIFKHLCLVADAAGNDIPDAYLAALAIRQDAVFVTADKAFERFKGLELELIE